MFMIVTRVVNEKQLNMLYNETALTFEGLRCDDKTLTSLYNWIRNHGCRLYKKEVYVISGAMMNQSYGLTGKNAYDDELDIVCIPLSDIVDPQKLFADLRKIGGRMFDDVVDTNHVRQNRSDRSKE